MIDITKDKIKNLEELSLIIKKLKAQNKIIVQCHGVFDLMHPGHIKHFSAAKRQGDILVVTITSDRFVNKGPGRPIFTSQIRAETIAALGCVDYVAVNDSPSGVDAIQAVRPDIYVKGSEYRDSHDFTGGIYKEAEAMKAIGGRIEFTDEPVFSSSNLINKFMSPYSEEAKSFIDVFKKKHSFGGLQQYFERIKKLKVLVIGETIIDEYHYVKAMGKSPKENIIATRYENEESFAGGILACANHIAGYCDKVDLVSCLGRRNGKDDFVKKHLKENIKARFFHTEKASTIVKRRFVDPVFLTKMFEVYYFNDAPIESELEGQILDYLEKVLPAYDLVIALDYGHGFLTPRIIDLIAKKSKFLAINTQTNSANFGFNVVTKYPRADYVCIDHLEARLAFRKKDVMQPEWKNIIKNLSEKLNTQKTIITMGHEGCLVYGSGESYKIPVFSTSIVDRVGAGDAFLAITSPFAAIGAEAELIGFIGNMVGAIAVTIVGNKKSVEPVTLLKALNFALK